MTATTLSKRGVVLLAKAEATIERGLATFMEVGAALGQIRDGKLYREQHDSFESYCRDRWNFTARRANQLMDAAEIGTMVPILNERQARELTPLKDDPAAVKAAHAEAVETGEVTAASLNGAVAKRRKVEPEAPHREAGDRSEGDAPTGAVESLPSGSLTAEGECAASPAVPPSAPSVCPTCGGTGTVAA